MRNPPDADPVTARTAGQLQALLRVIPTDPGGAEAVTALVDRLRRHRPPASAHRAPRWSGVGDDCSPAEWSLAWRPGGVDLRLLVEAQADPASPASYWAAGRDLTDATARELGADPSRAAAIEDLYAPGSATTPTFVAWHGFEWRDPIGAAAPRVKLYLNPAAADPAPPAVMAVVAETYRRLGFAAAWASIVPVLAGALPSHISLDLDASGAARFKLYVRVRDLPTAEAIHALGATARLGDVTDLVRALAGTPHDEPVPERLPRPGFVVLHHTDTASALPSRAVVNLHVPSLAGDDRTALDRIGTLLGHHDLPARQHADAVTALARDSFMGTSPFRATGSDPVGGQSRLQSYLSFQREVGGARITTYFGLRAFAARFGWRADDPVSMWPSPVPAGTTDEPAGQMPRP